MLCSAEGIEDNSRKRCRTTVDFIFSITLDSVLLENIAAESVWYFSNRRDPHKSHLRLSSLLRPNRHAVH